MKAAMFIVIGVFLVVTSALTDSLRLDGVGFALVAIGLLVGFVPSEPKVVKLTRRKSWSDAKELVRGAVQN